MPTAILYSLQQMKLNELCVMTRHMISNSRLSNTRTLIDTLLAMAADGHDLSTSLH